MVTIKEAISLIEKHVGVTGDRTVEKLKNAVGKVICQNVESSISMPPFRQSAMDGYAVFLHDNDEYVLLDEVVKAGDSHCPELKPGQAFRIFTGAPVSVSANAVVMQERVAVTDKGTIKVSGPMKEGDNIRPVGEQVKAGEVALKKGTLLTPAAIGFLASLGVAEVEVFKKPSVAIVTTGNELAEPGELLGTGKVYESNSVMLAVALESLGYENVAVSKVPDDYGATVRLLDEMIDRYDVVIASGGISVGDYDYVGKALNTLGVKEHFYKVKQKPGKPLFFGSKGSTAVFALPGNPAAALTCFYIYVYPALERISGLRDFRLESVTMEAANGFVKKGDRPQFLKAYAEGGKVRLLEGQSSAMLQTFALANALALVPAEQLRVEVGDKVEVFRLPG
ncbi:molybdopterin molybdenumtransferase MoeA [Fulvitalea axinellae]|uniref:Molybdopterin molybdenumtransferase n=1 Tax=Fulvitalea axinellae TaxID=1182444 RepID=A0AAU9CKN8_9BACT|nr:molybdopterin molybdenumtransferase MoeA [Fulvitalea axinellae]